MYLLIVFLIPAVLAPLAYLIEKRSPSYGGLFVASGLGVALILLSSLIPVVRTSGSYHETYYWIPILAEKLNLHVDGIGLALALITLILGGVATLYSNTYLKAKKNLGIYYALVALLISGLLGVFITTNMLLFYFCWEFILIPGYFIIGEWGYKDSYKAAFKFFIFTHAGAVFVLLGIGIIFVVTGQLDYTDAGALMATVPHELVIWALIAFTAGFSVKMAVFPVHMWLPDAHGEAPAPISAILSGIIIGAGAYAILRIPLQVLYPVIQGSDLGIQFLRVLALFGIVSAFFGALIALGETDLKRIIAYSSISHMGYVMFGLSLFPSTLGIVGLTFHLLTHAVSKSLLFFVVGALMHMTGKRDINDFGGLAAQMPITAIGGVVGVFSIAGVPAFACFISEFLIFAGGFQVASNDPFFMSATFLMIIVTVFSLAYGLRFLTKVFLGPSKMAISSDITGFMKLTIVIMIVFTIVLAVWPSPFIELLECAV